MKALSIRQPWAWLIANGYKDIENRTWKTYYKGPLYIHASKGMHGHEYEECEHHVKRIDPSIQLPKFNDLERGGVVGKVKMVKCVTEHASPWFNGPYGFVLKSAQKMDFHKVNGHQGLFNLDIEEKVKTRSRRQIMASQARKMKGKTIDFRFRPDDPDSRLPAVVLEAKIGKVHEPSGLLGYECLVQGRSGRTMTIDSNETFMKIYWDS